MDISLLEPLLRGTLAIEFALMAVYGLVAMAHIISIDVQIRQIAIVQQNVIDGIYQARLARWQQEAEERQKRIENLATS